MIPIGILRCCIREDPVPQLRANEGAKHFVQRLGKLCQLERDDSNKVWEEL